ncbi:hypothetical protein COT02_03265 [Candidatus Roizmanbacteria bacterium CG07_land_8_20_14_0_80_34_15]|uniref:Uncharacterized protein n=1 Tax=Candidatus Roizmanbacteria bacterium CG07_land_8_20_14_0_80_34_15 TaxID=1974849 RepID=A0A2M6YTX2_9BACT|nr:MAG: hypothetical protein COT02_03265 [Candidatus Roizmanbacteria bacterium CG07_land_8_20_14_0_80_34_15]
MKLKSYIFIIVLIIILTFILGVRYGQKVEKNDKIVEYILSITPYQTYTPYPLTPTKTASTSPTLIKLKK